MTFTESTGENYKIKLEISSHVFDKDYTKSTETMDNYAYYLQYSLNIIGIGDLGWK